MGSVDQFHGKTVFVDSMAFIYLIEDDPQYAGAVAEIFETALLRKAFQLVTSTITVAEVLVHPFRMKDTKLAERYEEILFGDDELTMLSIDRPVAKTAARLRAEYALKTPDALQLAAATVAGADCFLTNDKRLAKIAAPEIILIDDLL